MFPSFLALGLAFTLRPTGPLTVAATDGVPRRRTRASSGGLLYTAFQFGAVIGLAATSATMTAATADGALPLEGRRRPPSPCRSAASALGIAAAGRWRHGGPRAGRG